jgi:hypothetical protein
MNLMAMLKGHFISIVRSGGVLFAVPKKNLDLQLQAEDHLDISLV